MLLFILCCYWTFTKKIVNHIFQYGNKNDHIAKEPYFKVNAFMTVNNENKVLWILLTWNGIWYNEILYKINIENLHSIYIKHLNKTYLICDYNVGVTIIIYLFELF